MARLDYVSQALTKAISSLVSHPGRIADRMKSAYAEMWPVESKKLPDDLRSDWIYIEDRLNVGEGDVASTIDELSETDLSEIAIRILSFADRVDTFLREGRA
ncbi:MAG: hypothetical protein AB1781_01715 [Pseudomonadota bacterium]